jgi:hypothetical protein
MDVVLYALVSDDAKLEMESQGDVKRVLRGLIGEVVEVIIRKRRSKRSDRANRYYFGVVVKLMAEHCGYEPDEMHEALAFRFLRIEDDPITGSPRRKRTPKTNTAEFADYVDQCIRFAAELGVYVPQPGKVEA